MMTSNTSWKVVNEPRNESVLSWINPASEDQVFWGGILGNADEDNVG